MDRREFASLLPVLLAGVSALPESAAAESLPPLESGIFKPGKESGTPGQRVSHRYTAGMLKAGNIRLEMHETTIQPGAPHEAIGTHKHSEIWLVREGTAELMTKGEKHTLVAGDVGICVAGDEHYIANVSDAPVTYFVVTVGPPE